MEATHPSRMLDERAQAFARGVGDVIGSRRPENVAIDGGDPGYRMAQHRHVDRLAREVAVHIETRVASQEPILIQQVGWMPTQILDEIGSTPAAADSLERALAVQEELVRNHPEDSELRKILFSMYRHLGVLQGHMKLFLISSDVVQQHLQLTAAQTGQINEIIFGKNRA